MKKLEDITREELNAFRKHKRLLAYDPNDVAELDNLVRTFINQWHRSCSGCSGSLREAKDMANQFLADNEAKMEAFAKHNEEVAQAEARVKKEQNIVETVNSLKQAKAELLASFQTIEQKTNPKKKR